jgi:gliding motility-associated-like protein
MTAQSSVCSGVPFFITINSGNSIIFYRLEKRNDIPNSTWETVGQGPTELNGGTYSYAERDQISENTEYKLTIYTDRFFSTPSSEQAPPNKLITLYNSPQIRSFNQSAFCSGVRFDFTPSNLGNTIPDGTTYTWLTPSYNIGELSGGSTGTNSATISGTLVNSTNSIKSATYTITPTSPEGCPGDPFTLTIPIKPTPTIQSKERTICSGDEFRVEPANLTNEIVPAGTFYTWTVISNPDITGESASGTATSTVISQTLTNTTASLKTVIYTVTPTSADGCQGASFTVTVSVKPRPNIPNSNPPAICTGTSFIFTPTGIVPANIQYTWTVTDNPDVDGEINVFTPTAPFSQQLTNRGIEQEVVDYVVIPISDGCAGPSFNSSVTLIPNPQIDNPRRRTVCSGGDLSFTPQNITDGKVPANTLYTWTILANTNITGQTEQSIPQEKITGTSLINSTLNEEDLIYNVTTSTANGCATTTFQLIVKVVPVAQINNKDLNPICSGNSFTVIPGPPNYSGDIVVPGTTYTWSFVDNPNVNGESGVFSPTSIDKISQVLTNVSNTLQTVVYNVTSVSTNCAAANFTITANILPRPSITAQTTQTCNGDRFEVIPTNDESNIVPANTRYRWNEPVVTGGLTGGTSATAASTISGTLTNPTNSVQTATYSVTPISIDGCEGATFTVTVTVNPRPSIQAKIPAAICSGDSFTVTPTNESGDIVPVGTTYTWTVATNASVTGQSASSTLSVTSITQQLTNTTNEVQTVIYTVTPKSGDCIGGTFTITVTVNPKATIQAKTPAICSGDSFTVTPTNASGDIVPVGTTYTWTVASNTNVTGESPSSTSSVTSISQQLTNTTNEVQTVIYTVTPRSGNCDGVIFTITVTVNPRPSIQAKIPAAICSGDSFTVTPTNGSGDIVPLGTTYSWSIPSVTGGMTGGANATNVATISGTLTNPTNSQKTATYSITPLSGACTGGTFTLTVNINALPYSPTTTANTVVYNKQPHGFIVSLNPANASDEILRWYFTPGDFSTISPTHTLANTYTISVSSYNQLTQCESAQKVTASLIISKKFINAQASAIDKVYDQTKTATATVTSNELENGDIVNFAHGGAEFDNKNVGTGKSVALTNVTISPGGASSNYTLTPTSSTLSTTASITVKPITVLATADNRVYNATASATVTLSSPDVINPDDVLFNYAQALFNNKTANTGKEVNVTGIIISGGVDAENYTLTATTATTTGTISKSEITIIGAVASDRVYNGTISATITGGTITASILLADVVTLDLKGKFNDRYVGDNKPVTSISTIGGAEAANYYLTQPTGLTASISKKNISEISPVTQNKVYDATTKVVNYTSALKTKQAPGAGTVLDSIPYTIDDVSIVSTAEFDNKNVGNSKSISSTSIIDGVDKGNYELVKAINLTPRNITKKTLNMSGLSVPASKVYDGTTSTVLTDNKSLLTASLPGQGTVTDGKPYTTDISNLSITGTAIGNYNSKNVLTANTVTFTGLVLTGTESGNYSLTIQAPQPATITKKELTMSGLSVPPTKIYDATTKANVIDNKILQSKITAGTGNKDDGKPYDPDDVSLSGTAVANYNTKDVTTAIVVNFSGLSLTGADAGNYILKIQNQYNATIVPLVRNVVANQQYKIYGQVDPIFTYTADPLLESDLYSGELKRVDGKNVGSYPIEIGTLTGGSNYQLNLTPNVLIIDKAIMFITAKDAIRTYGDLPLQTQTNSTEFIADGLKYDEKVGYVTISYPNGPGSGNAINDSVGKYLGAVNAVDVSGGTFNVMNYKTIFFRGDLIVKKLPIIVSAESKEKREGQQDPALTFKTSIPLVVGDEFTGLITREPGEIAGAYQIQIGTLALNNNYQLTFRPAVFLIKPEEPTFVLPKAFTPNGDGVNDVLKIIQDGISSINYYQIFNRSGRLVFQTKDLSVGWDGRFNGVVLDSDAYYWNVEFVTWNKKVIKISGTVILIK